MILIWQSHGITSLFRVDKTPEVIAKIKTAIKKEVESFKFDASTMLALDKCNRLGELYDWVEKYTQDCDNFEKFQFSSLLELD